MVGDRRKWWDVRWSRSGAFRNERRHLVILSVLGGLVFFGAGLLGGTATTRNAAPHSPDTESFSATSQAGALSSGAAKGLNPVASTDLAAANIAASSDQQAPELRVHLYNWYTQSNEIELYPWEHLAEPHKPTTMDLLDWPESDEHVEYR